MGVPSTPEGRHRARRAALQALYQWQLGGQPPKEIRAQFLADQPMSKVDLPYFRELLDNIPSKAEEIDGELAPLLDRPVAQLDPITLAILRLGSYELSYRPDVPWKVVINEAVKLAKTFGAEQSHRFVNGILDRAARNARKSQLGL